MRAVAIIVLVLGGFALSGCVAYDVASGVAGAVTTVAGTAVDVATAPIDAVTGSDTPSK